MKKPTKTIITSRDNTAVPSFETVTRQIRHAGQVAILIWLLSGCTAIQKQHWAGYHSIIDAATFETQSVGSVDHEFVDAEELQAESIKMYRAGYVMLGYSNANSYAPLNPIPTVIAAKYQAEATGASKILHVRKWLGGPFVHEIATFWVQPKEFTLGAYYTDTPADIAAKIGPRPGVMVQMVAKNSPAETATIAPGDLLLTFNDKDIENAAMLDHLLAKNAGQKVIIGVWPSAEDLKPFVATVKLGDPSTASAGIEINRASEDAEYPTIERIIPGSPAAENGQLKIGDRIVGIADNQGRPVDIAGETLHQVLARLHGPRGSRLRLIVQSGAANERKEYSFTRERVVPVLSLPDVARSAGQANSDDPRSPNSGESK